MIKTKGLIQIWLDGEEIITESNVCLIVNEKSKKDIMYDLGIFCEGIDIYQRDESLYFAEMEIQMYDLEEINLHIVRSQDYINKYFNGLDVYA